MADVATKGDVKEIVNSMHRAERRRFWVIVAAVVPVTAATIASVLEIVRVVALGKL